ncbi:MAG: hypothetical protein NTZ43_03490 [Gemmatimonadetes bacterium]|nr:hypothetical protein [Gemmatimonadota bacterium]
MRRAGLSLAATTAVTLFALSAAVAPLRAQAIPAAKDLMAKHDAAIGGRAALDKYSTMRRVGAMAIPAMGLEASLEMLQEKSGKFLQKIVLGPMGEVQQGYDGKTAWAVQPGMGPVLLDGDQAKELIAQGDFYGGFHDASKFTSAETVEIADFEGRKCYKVKLVRKAGGEGFEYFDVETGLTAGVVRETPDPMNGGKMTTTQVISDYKDFGGVKMPTKIATKGGQFDMTLSFTAVEFDKVDVANFALPDAIKALVKP